jgi:xylulokinase
LLLVAGVDSSTQSCKVVIRDAHSGARTAANHLARAAVEGLLCGLADGLHALVGQGVRVDRVILIEGGARSAAVRKIAPSVLGHPVVVPPPAEYVADGAARQAAWALSGEADAPAWARPGTETFQAQPAPFVRERYRAARDLTLAST